MKCEKLFKMRGIYTLVGFFDLLDFPLGLKRILYHFPVQGKLMVCGLDHSGSQPFI